jgi:chemotaxis protein MotB
MTVAAMVLLVAGTGCYYGKWMDSDRALRATQEDLSRAKTDLLDCQHMNEQKNTQIQALQQQLETTQQSLASLNAENQGLRSALDEALGTAKELAGKQVGSTMIINRQLPAAVETALDDFVRKYPNLVERVGNSIRWKSDLLFPLGSDQMSVSREVQNALREFAAIIKSPDARGLELVIVGHTDTTRIVKPETLREHKTNWHLSTHRAIAVMRILSSLGIAESRMGVMGYGELRPIADNSTTEGKARNRRVEIYLVPKGAITGTGSTGVYENDEAGTFVKPSELEGANEAAPARNRAAGTRSTPRASERPAVPTDRESVIEEPPPAPPVLGEPEQ